ncbi:UNVERIFIED_CONTAM: hypothetical protein HHA_320660 [Hammondia hammondi]|eukprot:XP_008887994.1 hypothetical protein HHA_320660 [Hammondia hammondi]
MLLGIWTSVLVKALQRSKFSGPMTDPGSSLFSAGASDLGPEPSAVKRHDPKRAEFTNNKLLRRCLLFSDSKSEQENVKGTLRNQGGSDTQERESRATIDKTEKRGGRRGSRQERQEK